MNEIEEISRWREKKGVVVMGINTLILKVFHLQAHILMGFSLINVIRKDQIIIYFANLDLLNYDIKRSYIE